MSASPGEGLKHRLRSFFLKHPSEELSYLEASRKLGCSIRYAHEVGREMVLAGELEYVRVIRIPRNKRWNNT
jgi:AraC-like DNA-binding protein